MQATKSAYVDQVRSAASGRWKQVISNVAKISPDLLDGKHHACPSGKCGSKKDAFRVFDDFDKTGGIVCNQCGKKADGFASLMWLTGLGFMDVVRLAGSYLGVEDRKAAKDPAYNLEWIPWNESLAEIWCLSYRPIIQEALKLVGAKMAVYRGKYSVIAVPVWLGSRTNVVGWRIWNIRGKLPVFGKDKKVEWKKSKLTDGSQHGLIGTIPSKAADVWKVEGETDCLALLSCNPFAAVVCNSNGTLQNPSSFNWIKDHLKKAKRFLVLHDADEPGQEGAEKWSNHFSAVIGPSLSVINVELPYPIQATKGKDLRDWLAEGNTYDLLLKQADKFSAASPSSFKCEEAEDDPHRLARVNMEYYEREHNGRLVYWQGAWLKWKNGCYQEIEQVDLTAKVNYAIRKEFERSWSLRQQKGGDEAKQPVRKVTGAVVANTISAMASMCILPSKVSMPCWLPTREHKNYLAMENGLLDLDRLLNREPVETLLSNHSPHWFSTTKLSYKFDPTARCPKWERFLETSLQGDPQRIALLQEWAGYLLMPTTRLQKFMVLEGEGQNGKTVYFAGLAAMLGEPNVSRVSLEKFEGRFDLASTIGKMVNMCSDVSTTIEPSAEAVIKQYTGGETMQFDRKNLPPIQAKPTAKLMFAWNNPPRFHDRSNGLWRRLLLVPFNHKVAESERVYGMDETQFWIDSGELPGILNWAIVGMDRLQTRGRFSESDLSAKRMTDLQDDLNPIRTFFDELIEESEEGFIDCKLLYEEYCSWCRENGNSAMSMRKLTAELKRKFPAMEKKRKRTEFGLIYVFTNILVNKNKEFEE